MFSTMFPGLGQIIKGQWRRAIRIWLYLFVPFITYVAFGTIFGRSPSGAGASLVLIVPLLVLEFGIYLWQISDAYRHPIG